MAEKPDPKDTLDKLISDVEAECIKLILSYEDATNPSPLAERIAEYDAKLEALCSLKERLKKPMDRNFDWRGAL